MDIAYLNSSEFSFFSDAQEHFNPIVNQLSSEDYENNEHGDIEKHINQAGQELLRRLLQGWLNLKAANEVQKSSIKNAVGDVLNHVRARTTCLLTSLFGDVTVPRKGYSQRGHSSVFPLDAELCYPPTNILMG